MRTQAFSFTKLQHAFLHLLLVVGVFSYLYSPFLDHMLGSEVYARPHTHIHIPTDFLAQADHELDFTEAGGSHDHDHHDEGVLCFLDIDALLALLVTFNVASNVQLMQQQPLVFTLDLFYFHFSILHLSPLNPPPNF